MAINDPCLRAIEKGSNKYGFVNIDLCAIPDVVDVPDKLVALSFCETKNA